MAAARYLDAAAVSVRLEEGATSPSVQIDGEPPIAPAEIRRLYPLSHPDRYLAVLGPDGKEVGILRSLEELDPESQRALRATLDRRYFTPVVRTIESLKLEGGMWRFKVDTQRGPAEFYVRNWRDSAHEIGPRRWLVNSVDGQRFEIPGEGALDTRSQILLEQLL